MKINGKELVQYTCRNMAGQQPSTFSTTQVHHQWKYCKQVFGSYFFDSHCIYRHWSV